MNTPWKITRRASGPSSRLFTRMGGCSMMWRLAGSTPSASAGSDAVARFTHRIMTAVSGAFQFKATAVSSTTI